MQENKAMQESHVSHNTKNKETTITKKKDTERKNKTKKP